MNKKVLESFKHIFKLDPNRQLSEEQIEKLCKSGTDAIIIGGTLGITYEDTKYLLKEVRKYSIPVIQEISELEAIVPGFDYYFIPLVLNAQNPKWILNAHHQALKKYGELINWEQVFIEGYVVLNNNSSVAKLTESKTNLDLDDAIAYALMAEKMFKLPILYIEYSGNYGNKEWLKEIDRSTSEIRIFYGGGIKNISQAEEMAQYADTIIIGNLIYEDFISALKSVSAKLIYISDSFNQV